MPRARSTTPRAIAPNKPNFRVFGLKMRIELRSKAKQSQFPRRSQPADCVDRAGRNDGRPTRRLGIHPTAVQAVALHTVAPNKPNLSVSGLQMRVLLRNKANSSGQDGASLSLGRAVHTRRRAAPDGHRLPRLGDDRLTTGLPSEGVWPLVRHPCAGRAPESSVEDLDSRPLGFCSGQALRGNDNHGCRLQLAVQFSVDGFRTIDRLSLETSH